MCSIFYLSLLYEREKPWRYIWFARLLIELSLLINGIAPAHHAVCLINVRLSVIQKNEINLLSNNSTRGISICQALDILKRDHISIPFDCMF